MSSSFTSPSVSSSMSTSLSLNATLCLTDYSSYQHPARKPRVTSTSFCNDHLGKLVSSSVVLFCNSASWTDYMHSTRGEPWISSAVSDLDHPAAPLLQHLRQHGAPAQMTGVPWSPESLQSCLQRGPHKSALEYSNFVHEEMADFCDKGFWTVLPYALIKNLPTYKYLPWGLCRNVNNAPILLWIYPFGRQCQDTSSHTFGSGAVWSHVGTNFVSHPSCKPSLWTSLCWKNRHLQCILSHPSGTQ